MEGIKNFDLGTSSFLLLSKDAVVHRELIVSTVRYLFEHRTGQIHHRINTISKQRSDRAVSSKNIEANINGAKEARNASSFWFEFDMSKGAK